MPRKTPYEREMRKRHPGRVFNTQEEAEAYQRITQEKGLKYHIQEHKGLFYVDEYEHGHPYWGRIGGYK